MNFVLQAHRSRALEAGPLRSIDTVSIRKAERQARYRAGLAAEFWSGLLLMAKGYHILAWRHKTRAGEIDLVAAKGNVLAFVEVKRRQDLETAAAAITPRQSRRLRHAADLWLASRTRYHDFDFRFDAVLVAKSGWPTHVIDGA